MMYSILNEEPNPLTSSIEGIDPELDRIINRALDKDPDDRYQHVDDMVSELRKLKKQTSRVVRPQESDEKETRAQGAGQGLGFKWVGVGAIVVIAALSIWYFGGSRGSALDSVAVLPFVNAAGDPESEYLAEGITENIINRLSKISGLRVIPRSMVARFTGPDADPAAAGKELDVKAVLTGKISQRGENLVVQAELIDIGNLSQLWGDQYNRPLSDIISVQQEIAQTVVERLETRLTGTDEEYLVSSVTVDPQAYQLYIKGRYHWNKRTSEGSTAALSFFQQAIEIDPSFALAHVGVAECYFVATTMTMEPSIAMPRAAAALEKALALDPELPQVYSGLAAVEAYYNFDMAKGEEYLRRSIELDPGNATAYHWLAELLVWLGEDEEGFQLYKKALEIEPASLPILSDYGLAFFTARQYERSIEELNRAIRLDPNFVRSHYYSVNPYLALGMEDKAVEALLRGMEKEGLDAGLIEEHRKAYEADGFRGLGRVRVAWFEGRGILNGDLIMACLWAEDVEKAVSVIYQAAEEHNIGMLQVSSSPLMKDLRNDPRVQALLDDLGFIPP